jgi:hypothetical protein
MNTGTKIAIGAAVGTVAAGTYCYFAFKAVMSSLVKATAEVAATAAVSAAPEAAFNVTTEAFKAANEAAKKA